MTSSVDLKCHMLIDDAFYAEQYSRIKKDLGAEIIKDWTERTDPRRYVYEDCGIAAFLLALKQKFNLTFNYFADLACGNGVLSHVLAREGFNGVGIDARSRGIWDRFKAEGTDLRKTSMDPNDVDCISLPSNVDFIIGNHADQLLPWVPVIAARRNCCFFVIPCCTYDFFRKFNNLPTNKNKGGVGRSKVDQYLDYIESIGTRLGFQMHMDKLKTSSSKRICFLGLIPPEGLPLNIEERIAQLLSESCTNKDIKTTFKPVGDTVDSRNCTKLPMDFKQNLSRRMASVLIDRSSEKIGDWDCGGEIDLSDLSKHLTEEDKFHLKSQYGGLQTFLKNHSPVFHVKGGTVRMRRWPEDYIKYCKLPKKFKTSPCWFYLHHPQGCPVEDDTCPFIHAPHAPVPTNFIKERSDSPTEQPVDDEPSPIEIRA